MDKRDFQTLLREATAFVAFPSTKATDADKAVAKEVAAFAAQILDAQKTGVFAERDQLRAELAEAREQIAARDALLKEAVVVPLWKLDKISNGIRLSMNHFHSHNKETALDRVLCRASRYIAEALDTYNALKHNT